MPPAQPQTARKRQWPAPPAPRPQRPAMRRLADAPPGDDEARYPDLDTPPMISDHWKALLDTAGALEARYANRDDVFVGGCLTLYFVDGDDERALQPDVFVSFGSPNRSRRVWLAWNEGKLPDFILEVASRSTYRRDEREKRDIYERLGVTEYWQFDPTGDYLNPVLQGRRLNAAGAYALLPLTATPDGGLRGASEVLGLHIYADGPRLRLLDPAAGEFLLNHQEEHQAHQEERRARLAAEAEVEQLKRQLARRS